MIQIGMAVSPYSAGGEGHDCSDYEWKEGTIGPSLKFINGENITICDIDLMFGKLYNEAGLAT